MADNFQIQTHMEMGMEMDIEAIKRNCPPFRFAINCTERRKNTEFLTTLSNHDIAFKYFRKVSGLLVEVLMFLKYL